MLQRGCRATPLLAAVLIGLHGTALAECELPRNQSRAEICAYVRQPENECAGDGASSLAVSPPFPGRFSPRLLGAS